MSISARWIDPNLLENSIRPVAVGRKDYLFAESETGAEAAATTYSITETCRRIGLNRYRYLVAWSRSFGGLRVPKRWIPTSTNSRRIYS